MVVGWLVRRVWGEKYSVDSLSQKIEDMPFAHTMWLFFFVAFFLFFSLHLDMSWLRHFRNYIS